MREELKIARAILHDLEITLGSEVGAMENNYNLCNSVAATLDGAMPGLRIDSYDKGYQTCKEENGEFDEGYDEGYEKGFEDGKNPKGPSV